jgi:hypothetical protein
MNIQTITGFNPSFKEKAVHTGAIIPFSAARGSVRLFINQNVLGLGTVLYFYKTKNSNKWDKIQEVWYKFGGSISDLTSSINAGNQKDIRQVAPALLNRVSSIKKVIDLAYSIKAGKITGHKTIGLGGGGIYGEPVSDIGMILSSLPIILQIIQAFKGDVDAAPTYAAPTYETPQKEEKSSKSGIPMIAIGLVGLVAVYFLFIKKGK